MQSQRDAVRRALEPRSIAVVGASARPGSFGERLAIETLRSTGVRQVHLVHPSHPTVQGRDTVPSLAELPEPVDLVLLGVPDTALVDQLELASSRGDGGAVVFGTASGLADSLRDAADGLALVGGGCMGFVNPARGIRAIGYIERAEIPRGGIALVTHSGSVFSALLRTHRRLEYSFVVSSGQELVTTTADYLHYALDLPETRVVGLFLETMRDVESFRAGLTRAAAAGVPVVALTVGTSAAGQSLVTAHSGAVAGGDAAWEALFRAYGVHRAHSLDELVDTLELFSIGRRISRPGGMGPGSRDGQPHRGAGDHGPTDTAGATQAAQRAEKARLGIATVHDSGGERTLAADVAERVGAPLPSLAPATRERLAALLEPGLEPGNPLDVWGTGAGTESLFHDCLVALADDPAIGVTALAIDLVEEFDGDDSYPDAILRAHRGSDAPFVVLAPTAAAVHQPTARRLRTAGIPVLEGLESGLRALTHLVSASPVAPPPAHTPGPTADLTDPFVLLATYGITVAGSRVAGNVAQALAAAGSIGYPVALKTAAADIAHKVDAGGVVLGLADDLAVMHAYADLAARLGPGVLVQAMTPAGVELALGVVRDPHLGPLVLVAAGGTLVELVAQRVVALPPVSHAQALALLDEVPLLGKLLDGVRGAPPASREAVADAIVSMSHLALALPDHVAAVDVNPLICTPTGAVAVDVLVELAQTDRRVGAN
ncbi:MAG: acetate--CoA ligase family protein [Nocardioidaceae bacterium]